MRDQSEKTRDVSKLVVELDRIESDWIRKHPKSSRLFEEAKKLSPGGAHHAHAIRFWCRSPGVCPPYAVKAQGTKVWDVDGNEYTDYWSHGALFLGHSNPAVVNAIQEQAALGPSRSDFTEIQVKHMKKITKMIPHAEVVDFTMSGTEALMGAIRIARTFTKREKIIQLEGTYHGFSDQLMVQNPSGGIPKDCYKNQVLVPEDIEVLEKAVKTQDPAAVLLETVHGSSAGNMAVGAPNSNEFFRRVREITEENDVVLINDEVITGFRLAPGGAQEYFEGLKDQDMAGLGKNVGGSIGGSGAIVGKTEIMEAANPTGKKSEEYAFTGGTFAGNPLNSAAGYAALDIIDKAEGRLNRHANTLGERFRKGLNDVFERHKFPAQAVGCGSFNNVCFTQTLPVKDSHDFLQKNDRKKAYKYRIWLMTYAGIICQSGFYISAVHTTKDIDDLIAATEDYVKREKA